MRPNPSRRARSPLNSIMLGTLVLLFGAAATIGGLWAAGVELPFLKSGPDTRGMVAVPLATRMIPAHTKVNARLPAHSRQGAPEIPVFAPGDGQANGGDHRLRTDHRPRARPREAPGLSVHRA